MKNKINKNTYARLDILLLCIFPVFAASLSLATNINFLLSTILFFGLPGIYLSFRTKHAVKRCLLFAVVATFGAIIIEYFAGIDKSWYVYSSFPRILTHIAVEDVIWGFLLVYFIVIYYEHFFDKGRHRVVGRGLKYFGLMLVGVLTLFSTLYILNPGSIEYFYFKAGVVLLFIPVVTILTLFPKYISIALKITPYFFCLGFIFAIISIHKGYWYYPGQNFIGWINIGTIRFPIEEMIYWMTLIAISIVVYFEFFDDNSARLPQRIYNKVKN